MTITRATHLGMCFGVRDAIALAKHHAGKQPVTVLGELVHNETVLRDLTAGGIRFAKALNGISTPTVMITAHGTSQRTLDAVNSAGLSVVEATCPLVHYAHRGLRELIAAGCHPVIIGQREHVEVRGLTDDLDEFDVVLSEEEARSLRPRARFGIVAQTTQPIARVQRLVRVIEETFPSAEVHFRDTVCQPTKQRQAAAVALAQSNDVVVVIGGANSNNTRELVATCRQHCSRVLHVQDETQLRADWFFPADRVGVTAGTSTPDAVIAAVEERLRAFSAVHEQREHVTVAP
jgi:4-hydroxy-3-methylbut-2-en-1-yl diphosphate reductase